ncbi:hypothetical protein LAC81_31970 [Ensifer adhaerens]|nr:hypothetical protein [Ensifer adhaerens]MBZ7925358.1 hypothetical protein [Ensifer adhaerens]UAX95477.1 hypothetical protein LAC78_31860 [Ensifer adhaerens]UAY02632.1 hypothetical protein LAC80_28450 [Ensifer adhaerens]UAY10616.1 hypothetical protein LAC81_31970 [Ensifer adhaerens]
MRKRAAMAAGIVAAQRYVQAPADEQPANDKGRLAAFEAALFDFGP